MLRPTQSVEFRTGSILDSRRGVQLVDRLEILHGGAGDCGDFFDVVAGVMSLEHLQNAAGILKSRVLLRDAVGVKLEDPRRFVILPGGGIITGKETVLKIELVINDERSVGVVSDILFEVLVVIENVFDHTAEKGDIGAGAQSDVMIRQRRRSGKAGIHVDDFGASFLPGAQHPLEGNGMHFCGVAAHDQNNVGILDIDVMIGHGTTAERLSQSRYARTVSDPGLMIHLDDAQRPHRRRNQPTFFIV